MFFKKKRIHKNKPLRHPLRNNCIVNKREEAKKSLRHLCATQRNSYTVKEK